jgi:hypothetical protein
VSTEPKHWNPTPDADGRLTLANAVGQALGSASVCWSNLDEAGEFNDVQCAEVYDGLMAWLSDWADEHRKQANEATAGKLCALIREALATDEADNDVTSAEAIWEQSGYRRGLAAAADIAQADRRAALAEAKES